MLPLSNQIFMHTRSTNYPAVINMYLTNTLQQALV
jgi:hypothetical protein